MVFKCRLVVDNPSTPFWLEHVDCYRWFGQRVNNPAAVTPGQRDGTAGVFQSSGYAMFGTSGVVTYKVTGKDCWLALLWHVGPTANRACIDLFEERPVAGRGLATRLFQLNTKQARMPLSLNGADVTLKVYAKVGSTNDVEARWTLALETASPVQLQSDPPPFFHTRDLLLPIPVPRTRVFTSVRFIPVGHDVSADKHMGAMAAGFQATHTGGKEDPNAIVSPLFLCLTQLPAPYIDAGSIVPGFFGESTRNNAVITWAGKQENLSDFWYLCDPRNELEWLPKDEAVRAGSELFLAGYDSHIRKKTVFIRAPLAENGRWITGKADEDVLSHGRGFLPIFTQDLSHSNAWVPVEGLYTYNFSVLCWRSFEDIAAPIPDDDQIGLHNRFAQQSQDALGVHGKIGTAEKAVMVALAALERMALLAGQTPKILPLGVERLRTSGNRYVDVAKTIFTGTTGTNTQYLVALRDAMNYLLAELSRRFGHTFRTHPEISGKLRDLSDLIARVLTERASVMGLHGGGDAAHRHVYDVWKRLSGVLVLSICFF